MKLIRIPLVAAALVCFSTAAHAVTYLVPSDREMIQRSDEVVIAVGVTSVVEENAQGGLVTRSTLRIEEVLKGERAAGEHLVLTETGGRIGDRIQYVPGTPEYQSGVRYLVFTESNRHGEPVTFGMGLGQFFFTSERGQKLALRAEVAGFDQNLSNHVEQARDAAAFLDYIRGIVAQRIDPEPRYFVPDFQAEWHPASEWKVATEATRGSYLMEAGGNPFRWSTPSATFVLSDTAVGVSGLAAVQLSYDQWNGTASTINYGGVAQDNTALGGLEGPDGKNTILFDDPNDEVPGGIAGRGGITSGGGEYALGGETFWNMFEVDVVMNNGGFTQSCYNTVMVHEVGHTLGFRHSNQPPSPGDETTTDAIMNSSVSCGWQGILKTYDNNAAATVYGSGPSCTPPGISAQPVNRSITPPASASLSVTASGTGPFTYEWFLGTAGDTSTAAGTGASINVSPALTSNYWVRITGQCPPAKNSNTVTVTVEACVPPLITTAPNDRTIVQGSSTQLTVTAAGTSLHYQWFVGATGNTSQTIGTDSKTLTVSPSANTTYWVRVSGACGSPVDSVSVVVTVEACPPVNVGAPTSTPSGANTTLNITASSAASGSLSYAWFRGNTPGVGGTFVASTKSTSVAITSDVRNYWVRVTNSCGTVAFSSLIPVASCALPVPLPSADLSLVTGSSTTLSVALVNTSGVTAKWYRGVAPDKTTQIGTGFSISTGPLTATTSFWAAVANACGEVATRTIVITVTAPICTAPAVTTGPLSQQVPAATRATLSVIATGTEALSYQWYEGVKSDTTRPVEGATLPVFVSPKILKATSYWVRVTNACGVADSEAAMITVPPGRRRAAAHR